MHRPFLFAVALIGLVVLAWLWLTPIAKPHAQHFDRFGIPDVCTNLGGYEPLCVQAAHRRGTIDLPAARYASGGVWVALRRGRCLPPGSVYGFHRGAIPALGNAPAPTDVQRRELSHWPRLLHHIDRIGAFNSQDATYLSAEQVSALTGKPMCR